MLSHYYKTWRRLENVQIKERGLPVTGIQDCSLSMPYDKETPKWPCLVYTAGSLILFHILHGNITTYHQRWMVIVALQNGFLYQYLQLLTDDCSSPTQPCLPTGCHTCSFLGVWRCTEGESGYTKSMETLMGMCQEPWEARDFSLYTC